MPRASIALCAILKNEIKNIERFVNSFKPYVDNIYITDTGSTDGTREKALELGCIVSDFKWINDFAAARNFNFSQAKEDYILWADLDDVLDNPEAFVAWRDHAMSVTDFWFVNYHYAQDSAGNPIVTFARERVVKRIKQYKWLYFVHEGMIPQAGDGSATKVNVINTWAIKHMRTLEDMAQDKGRNLRIFEEKIKEEPLNTRMMFYYGKELFDNDRFKEAEKFLIESSAKQDAQPHDRILSIQYAAICALKQGQFLRAIELSQQGLLLDPNRAEFFCSIGDALASQGNLQGAMPQYFAAVNCKPVDAQAGLSPLYSQKNCYMEYPCLQLSKIYLHMGAIMEAEKFASTVVQVSDNKEARDILAHIARIKPIMKPRAGVQKKTDDIVFSCPAYQAYPFDPEIMAKKGVGGSETALIHMAKYVRKHSGRPVKVFTQREDERLFEGVEYLPSGRLMEYMAEYEPRHHIAWRHNTKITNAKTYVWSHDLITPGIHMHSNFDKLLCLSEFHRDYAHAMQGVPLDKIFVTRNGIDPARFRSRADIAKIPGKVFWSSSPDRGLERVIRVLGEARKVHPEINLHVYYGVDNMIKFGQQAEADRILGLMKDKPWITYYGNVDQNTLAKSQMESCICLYPSDFIETFCLTVLEAACAGAYLICRDVGAMKDSVKWAKATHCGEFLDINCEYPHEYAEYTQRVISAFNEKKWENNHIDAETISWDAVAQSWVTDLLV